MALPQPSVNSLMGWVVIILMVLVALYVISQTDFGRRVTGIPGKGRLQE